MNLTPQAAAVIGRVEIRNPFALLENKGIKSTSLWFALYGTDKNSVGLWEDCELMTPQWCLSIHHREEAIEEIKSILEGSDTWKLLSTTAPELKSLVEIDTREKVGLY